MFSCTGTINYFIGRLFGDIFYSTPVNRLFIKDTPVTILDNDLFFGINHTLSELHIVNSKLVEFPSGPLKVNTPIHFFFFFSVLYSYVRGTYFNYGYRYWAI